MQEKKSILELLKPGIPKKYLLIVAAVVWTFAGIMLLSRGYVMLEKFPYLIWLKILGSLAGGIVFYIFMFSGISMKHIKRITNLPIDKPCFFSFFNLKSYLMMIVMISAGVALRMTGIIPLEYLSLFYITMGTPLFLSATRFYYYGIKTITQK